MEKYPDEQIERCPSDTQSIDRQVLIAERKVIAKMDRHIVPVVMLLYLLSFLDRVNIGNACLFGLEEDLKLKGTEFQTALILLFVTYIVSEVPSNLILKKARPSRWLAFIAVCWGIIATLTGLVQNFAGLAVCGLLLGLFEGGLFPGLAVYLTLFYTKKELGFRIGYLFVCSALSGSVGGLLAFGIGYMDGIAGLRGWRWIFIIEGIPTFLTGIAAYFLLADTPETAYYLTPEERQLAQSRIDRQSGFTKASQQFRREDALTAITDWKVGVFCVCQLAGGTMLYGFSTFLPTIIKALGKWTVPQTQALTVPVYALGAITYVIVAYFSDRQQMRGPYVVAFAIVSVIGYGILLSNSGSGVHYFGCYVVACGLYVVLGIPLSWLPTLFPAYGKRTTAVGMQLAVSNVAGIFYPFLYPSTDGPRYVKGHATTLGLIAFEAFLATGMTIYFSRVNKARLIGKEDYKMDSKTEAEIREMADDSPRFLYTV